MQLMEEPQQREEQGEDPARQLRELVDPASRSIAWRLHRMMATYIARGSSACLPAGIDGSRFALADINRPVLVRLTMLGLLTDLLQDDEVHALPAEE